MKTPPPPAYEVRSSGGGGRANAFTKPVLATAVPVHDLENNASHRGQEQYDNNAKGAGGGYQGGRFPAAVPVGLAAMAGSAALAGSAQTSNTNNINVPGGGSLPEV